MRTLEWTPAKLMNEWTTQSFVDKINACSYAWRENDAILTPAPCCVGQVGKQGKLDSLEILRRKNDDAV